MMIPKSLAGVRAFSLGDLEEEIRTKTYDELNKRMREVKILFRENPILGGRARIEPEREKRKLETTHYEPKVKEEECYFCHPQEKCSKFPEEFGLKKIYFLNESVAFSNLYPIDEVMGVVVYNYKKHIISPIDLSYENWRDGLLLVKKVFEDSKKKYLYNNVNFGPKSAASIEHFHGQFICSNHELTITKRVRENINKFSSSAREFWRTWVKAMFEKDLVLHLDEENEVALFVEWAPILGKSELVILSLNSSSLGEMGEKELRSVAKLLEVATKIFVEYVSDQFTILNISSFIGDDFCNQFRIASRAPLKYGMKVWEGFLELSGESVPNILPEELAQNLKGVISNFLRE